MAIKFLLTSAGFQNKHVADVFLSILNKPISSAKVVFIPTAARFDDERKYVKESHLELVEMGIVNIITLKLDHPLSSDEVLSADVIYVCGGNTFYLLKKIRESGFDSILNQFHGIYVGVSAGSIVVGPNIEVATPWDANDTHLSDTTGLKLVDFALIPHYQRKDKVTVNKLKETAQYKVIEITDSQAIMAQSGRVTIIQ